jgi:MFS family permease
MTSDAQILAPPATAGEGTDPRRWLTLIILLLAAFMNLLDVSIVNIAVPSIQRDLRASYADVQWALAGYTLAYALVLITGGRLGDTFGRKRLFLIGVTGFTIMSALCGAATGPGILIACRVVQGAMGAIMVPQVLAVIQVIFPPAERIKALAGFGVTAGLGTVSGPLLGGLLIQHNLFGLTWRPIFLISSAGRAGRSCPWPPPRRCARCSSGGSGSRRAGTARRWCRCGCSRTVSSAWAWPSR